MLVKSFFIAGVAVAAVGIAQAGKLDRGTWIPSGCGDEPVAPAGLNLSSPDAYGESAVWVKAYEVAIAKYSHCMVDEANADNAAINDAVRGREAHYQAFIDQVNEDAKRAVKMFGGGNGNGISATGRHGGSQGQGQSLPQSDGDDANVSPQ